MEADDLRISSPMRIFNATPIRCWISFRTGLMSLSRVEVIGADETFCR